jgi:nicotinate phosphoribosyltransferase
MAIEARHRTRLDPSVFRLPVERITAGWYSDAYFNFTRQLLKESGQHPHVTMQVFQKKTSILGGIDEAVAVLKLCSDDWSLWTYRRSTKATRSRRWRPS